MPKGVPITRRVRWEGELAREFREFAPGHSEAEIREHFRPLVGFDLTEGQIGNAKQTLGVRSGTHGGQFGKGHVPFNRGKRMEEYMTPAQMEKARRTMFKKGTLSGAAKAKVKEVGYERVNKDGLVEVRVPNGEGGRYNFVSKGRLVWEQANGRKLPPGHVVRFRDGDNRNFDPDNLVAVSMRDSVVMNSIMGGAKDAGLFDAAKACAHLMVEVFDATRDDTCAACGKPYRKQYRQQARCRECIDAGVKAPRRRTRNAD